jgi:acetyl esterase/lipase
MSKEKLRVPLAALVVAVVLASVAAAGTAEYRNPTVGRELALQVPDMHLAQVKRNVVYAEPTGRPLALDVYRPKDAVPDQLLPAVLLVHGTTSDPSPKDWGAYVGWGQLLAAHGVAGIPFNHRGVEADVRAALAFVRTEAVTLGVDARRICVASFSGGVPIGFRAALRDARIRCVLGFYGAPSPRLIRRGRPPVFIGKAGLDSSVINDAINAFKRRAVRLRAKVRVVTHPRGVHGFDVRNHDARSREILRQAVSFARSHLG